MNFNRRIAQGVVMACAGITLPIVSTIFHPVWWQCCLITLFAWALCGFGSIRATRAWIRLNATFMVLQREELLLAMDQRYQQKEPNHGNH